MKKVYTQSNSKVKMSKDRKIAGYLIIVFALFWSMCSILGFIAFCRTAKEDDTVVASAESFGGRYYANLWNWSNIEDEVASNSNISDFYYDNYYDNFTYSGNFVIPANTPQFRAFYLRDLVDSSSYAFIDSLSYFKPFICSFTLNIFTSQESNYYVFLKYYYDDSDGYSAGQWTAVNSFSKSFDVSLRLGEEDNFNWAFYFANPSSSDIIIEFSFPVIQLQYLFNYASTFVPPDYPSVYASSLYMEGYNDGMEYGFQQGYEAGYREGSSEIQVNTNGIFNDSTIDLEYVNFFASQSDYENDIYSNVSFNDVVPSILDGYIDFRQFARYFQNNVISYESFERLNYTINFAQAVPLEKVKNIYFVGVSTSAYNGLTLATSDGRIYSVPFVLDEVAQINVLDFSSVPIDSNSYILSVSSWFGGGVDGCDFSLFDADGTYQQGFIAGYNEGFSKGYAQGLDDNAEESYQLGYTAGYNVGLEEGADMDNIFTFDRLISAVIDVPVNAFRSMFNFELLGVNLANFGFAILSVCLVLAVIKFIL